MSAEINEIIKITTSQLTEVFKGQDELSGKLKTLQERSDGQKSDIAVLAKHIKATQAKCLNHETFINEKFAEIIEAKVSETIKTMMETMEFNVQEKINSALQIKLSEMQEPPVSMRNYSTHGSIEEILLKIEKYDDKFTILEQNIEGMNQSLQKCVEEVQRTQNKLEKYESSQTEGEALIKEFSERLSGLNIVDGNEQKQEKIHQELHENNFKINSLTEEMRSFDLKLQGYKEDSNKIRDITNANSNVTDNTSVDEIMKRLNDVECVLKDSSEMLKKNETVDEQIAKLLNLECFVNKNSERTQQIETSLANIEQTVNMCKSSEKEAAVQIQELKNAFEIVKGTQEDLLSEINRVQEKSNETTGNIQNSLKEIVKKNESSEENFSLLSKDLSQSSEDLKKLSNKLGELLNRVEVIEIQVDRRQEEEQISKKIQLSFERIEDLQQRIVSIQQKTDKFEEDLSFKAETLELNNLEANLAKIEQKSNKLEDNVSFAMEALSQYKLDQNNAEETVKELQGQVNGVEILAKEIKSKNIESIIENCAQKLADLKDSSLKANKLMEQKIQDSESRSTDKMKEFTSKSDLESQLKKELDLIRKHLLLKIQEAEERGVKTANKTANDLEENLKIYFTEKQTDSRRKMLEELNVKVEASIISLASKESLTECVDQLRTCLQGEIDTRHKNNTDSINDVRKNIEEEVTKIEILLTKLSLDYEEKMSKDIEGIKEQLENGAKNVQSLTETNVKKEHLESLKEELSKTLLEDLNKRVDLSNQISTDTINYLQEKIEKLEEDSLNHNQQLDQITKVEEMVKVQLSELKEMVEDIKENESGENKSTMESMAKFYTDMDLRIEESNRKNEENFERLTCRDNEVEEYIKIMEKKLENSLEETRTSIIRQEKIYDDSRIEITKELRNYQKEKLDDLENRFREVEEVISNEREATKQELAEVQNTVKLVKSKITEEVAQAIEKIITLEEAQVTEGDLIQLCKEISRQNVSNLELNIKEQIEALKTDFVSRMSEKIDKKDAESIFDQFKKGFLELEANIKEVKRQQNDSIVAREGLIQKLRAKATETYESIAKAGENGKSQLAEYSVIDQEDTLDSRANLDFNETDISAVKINGEGLDGDLEAPNDQRIYIRSINETMKAPLYDNNIEDQFNHKSLENIDDLSALFEYLMGIMRVMNEEMDHLKKEQCSSTDLFRQENRIVKEKISECEKNSKDILESISHQEEKLKTWISSEEEKEASNNLDIKRNASRLHEKELIDLEERLRSDILLLIEDKALAITHSVEDEIDQRVEKITEVIEEVKGLLSVIGKDKAFKEEDVLEGSITLNDAEQRISAEGEYKASLSEGSYEDQNTMEDYRRPSKSLKEIKQEPSQSLLTSIWDTIGLMNERIGSLESVTMQKSTPLPSVQTLG